MASSTYVKPVEAAKLEPAKTFSLFDTHAPEMQVVGDVDEEEEILAQASDGEHDDRDGELDEAA